MSEANYRLFAFSYLPKRSPSKARQSRINLDRLFTFSYLQQEIAEHSEAISY